MLAGCEGILVVCERGGSCAAGSDRRRSESGAKARVAGAGGAAECGSGRAGRA
jgi:hypothetical protein